jgi:N-methylhydantoinase B/oxoprolinase/acetone carboxylase alpha subunit
VHGWKALSLDYPNREYALSTSSQLERITLDLLWQRIIAILEDETHVLIRTAFSTSTREAGDLSTGLFDSSGRMMAQAVTGTPGHVNSMALAVKHFLRRFPLSDLSQGDVLCSNDPWLCSGHLHDFTFVTPVFHNNRPVGVVANTIHVVDIGGLGFGPDARDVFEEGLCIPICKLMHRGHIDRLLLDVIRTNVREPEQVTGDLYSSIAGNEIAARRISELLRDFAQNDLEQLSKELISRTGSIVEERISKLADGTYRNEITLDGYDAPVTIRLALTVTGSRMILDFSGSSGASARGINVPMNYTSAYAVFGVNCALNPDIPCNEGSLAPIEVVAPLGSILNPSRPSAVSARHMIGQILPDVVLGALAPLMAVPAEGAGLLWSPSLRGLTKTGRAFAAISFNTGGAGAHFDRDGWNTTAFPSGVKAMPVESVEATVPVIFKRKELRPNSGGAGTYRGGLGQIIELEGETSGPLLVNAMFDRVSNPARGRCGGEAGAPGRVYLSSGRPFGSKGLYEVLPNDTLVLELPGGGGFGDSKKRSLDAIAADLHDEYITPDGAQLAYGVVPHSVPTTS